MLQLVMMTLIMNKKIEVLVDFYDVHSTDHRIFYFSQGASMEGTYGGTLVSIASGYRNTNGALIGIQFKPEAGNWSDGTFTIYGRKI